MDDTKNYTYITKSAILVREGDLELFPGKVTLNNIHTVLVSTLGVLFVFLIKFYVVK